jgi:hypothetical protein
VTRVPRKWRAWINSEGIEGQEHVQGKERLSVNWGSVVLLNCHGANCSDDERFHDIHVVM